MKFVRPTILMLSLAALAFSADAKPARRGVMTVTQPDGTTLKIQKYGDETMHFVTTPDGLLLHEGNDGFYTFGTVDTNGAVVSTGISASADASAVKTVNIHNLDLDEIAAKRRIEERRAQTIPGNVSKVADDRARAPQTGYGLVSSTYPRTGSPKGLIILVQYQDVKFKVDDPKAYFDDMINGENFTQYGGTGSALQYFRDQSLGKFIPSFDVLGPVTLGREMKYYGGNDIYGSDSRPHLMVSEAVTLLDPTTDFSIYDTDGDGLIDNVYVFYAGAGEADGGSPDTVWPHSWDVRSGGIKLTVDGVTVAHYACSNEWDTMTARPDGIGTFVHEFSHVMGLPDLYHTTQMVYYTPCEYNVLDYGCYNNESRTPPFYTAYERNAMGWVEPIMLDKTMNVSLDNISTGKFGLIATEKDTEFFLLENRQLEGWDAYIPGHGMVIWHIDFVSSVFTRNVVNNTQNHQYVDLVEANNIPNGSSWTTMQGWTFPGSTNVTSFTANTKPALQSWDGKPIDMPITDITEEDGIVSFKVKGGVTPLQSPAPSASVGSDTDRFFTASWAAVAGAKDYFITVTAADSGPQGTIENHFDGSKIPEGWESSYDAWYTSATNYGTSAPSYKFANNNQSLTSPSSPGDIASVSFWAKGQTSKNGTSLYIDGLVNGEWTRISEYTPKNLQVENVNIDMPQGVRQVRFTFHKVDGNLAIDDIVLKYGGKEFKLAEFTNKSTGGATSVKVDNLIDGYDTYYFTVAAHDGLQRSKASDPVYVTVKGMNAGVSDIIADSDNNDAPVEYYNLQGVRVANPTPGSLVIERRGTSTRKVIIR